MDSASSSLIESGRHPQAIASRFLQRTIAGRDHARQCSALVVRFLEVIGTVRHFALCERNDAESMLLEDMEHRGDTRRRSVQGSKRLQDLAIAGGRLEAVVRYWESNVLGRCDDLQRVLEEEASPRDFHDDFMELARKIIQEISTADWSARPPHPPPWNAIPSFFHENLFELSKRRRTDLDAKLPPFQLVELWCWHGIAPRVTSTPRDGARTTHEALPQANVNVAASPVAAACDDAATQSPAVVTCAESASRHSTVRLNISCACIDDSDPFVTQVYLATERGMIFSMPIECLFPQTEEERSAFHTRVSQLAFRNILERRTRSDAAAAGFRTLEDFRHDRFTAAVVSHKEEGRPSSLDPMAIAVPPSPAVSSLSLPPKPSSPGDASGGSAATSSTPNTFIFQEGPIKVFAGHVYRVNSLQLISHGERGKMLVTTSSDKTFRWFNANTGALVGLVGPERSVCSGASSYIQSIDTLLTGHLDGSVKLWDVQSGALVRTLVELSRCPIHACHVVPPPPGPYSSASSPSDDVLAGSVGLRGPAAPQTTTYYTVMIGCRNGHIYGLRFATISSPRGKAWNNDLSRDPVEVTHGFLPETTEGSILPLDASLICKGGHAKSIVKMVSLASYLFTGDTEGKVIKWDLEHREKLMQYRGHIDDITALVATSDGLLFTASKDGLFIMWDSITGVALQKVGRHYHQVVGLAVGFRHTPSAAGGGALQNASPASAPLSPPIAPSATAAVPPSPAASIGTTTSVAKKRRGKGKGKQLQRTTETPFPLIVKQYRMDLPGSRECVALAAKDVTNNDNCRAAAADDSLSLEPMLTSRPIPFVLSISKDDSMIIWGIDPITTDSA
jgi:WD40 repeat protein